MLAKITSKNQLTLPQAAVEAVGVTEYFDVQVRAVLGRTELSARDHRRATDHVVSLILRGCGLQE